MATVPLVRNLGTARPNSAPYRTDSAAWMASPIPALRTRAAA
jgi:hypothetical protein